MNNIISQEEKDRIDALCKQFLIENYTINPDGSIDVDDSVDIRWKYLKAIPLNFNKVTEDFYCNINSLTSLVGCPKYVGGSFYCDSNVLTSLKGCPTEVGGDFGCDGNELTSLEHFPQVFDGEITFYGNSLPEAFELEFYALRYGYGGGEELLSEYNQNIFLKYQHHYDVWTPKFNEENMNDLILDIQDGLK